MSSKRAIPAAPCSSRAPWIPSSRCRLGAWGDAWEYEVQITAPTIPWLKRGMAISHSSTPRSAPTNRCKRVSACGPPKAPRGSSFWGARDVDGPRLRLAPDENLAVFGITLAQAKTLDVILSAMKADAAMVSDLVAGHQVFIAERLEARIADAESTAMAVVDVLCDKGTLDDEDRKAFRVAIRQRRADRDIEAMLQPRCTVLLGELRARLRCRS